MFTKSKDIPPFKANNIFILKTNLIYFEKHPLVYARGVIFFVKITIGVNKKICRKNCVIDKTIEKQYEKLFVIEIK